MADNSKIEWTDATWNPITGCSVVSAGCTNCYAMQLAGTRLKHIDSRKGLTRESGGRPKWTGEVRFNEKFLTVPLRWKKPRKIFVCAHGDLFHENVPDEWIDRVFAVMALCPQHTFQVLTKRADRMRKFFNSNASWRVWKAVSTLLDQGFGPDSCGISWPLPNVWLGVSVEDQNCADERIPDLLSTPAAVRFLSCEPLLGPLDWIAPVARWQQQTPIAGKTHIPWWHPLIDWIIAGGESGPGARPMHPEWARSLRDQCAAAGVAFHFKQWGEWHHAMPRMAGTPGQFAMMSYQSCGLSFINATKIDHYPRQFTAFGSVILEKVGKKHAGRLLDGVEHNGFPA